MKAPSLLLAVLLVVYATQKAEAVDKVRCRNADFCSTGKLHHYVGFLDSAEQTKQAFELTAWKKELVVFAETRLEPAAHTLDRYRRAGYGHIIPVMPTLRDCTRLARVFEAHPSVLAAAANPPPGEEPYTSSRGNITCGFYRTEDASGNQYGSGFEYLAHNVGRTAWWRKWFTAARAVSLGYNVMSVDADTLPLGDWYGMVKAPPAADYAVISQAEYFDNINGGFTYIQNAAPGGPASYLLYELMQRAVRWAENASALGALSPRLLSANPERQGWWYQEDQTLLSDVVYSCLAGRPVYHFTLHFLGDDTDGWAKLGGKELVTKTTYDQAIHKLKLRDVRAEPPLAARLWGDAYPPTQPPSLVDGGLPLQLTSGLLRMPHAGGQWPQEYGGYLYGTPGPHTLAFRKAFTDLGVPLPPDPEDPADEERAKSAKNELFLLAGTPNRRFDRQYGTWLEHGWFAYGRLGHWHLHLNPPYTGGMGHVHAGLNPSHPADEKRLSLLFAGHFNFHLQARMYGGPAHVFMSTAADMDASDRLRQVVAYAPGVIKHNLSKSAYVRAAQELARVAAALGAAVAWPAADCSSDWVLNPEYRNLSKPLRHSIPWVHINTAHAVSPFGSSLEELQCEWTGFTQAGCISPDTEIRALLAVELHHLLRHNANDRLPPQQRAAGEPTALLLPPPPDATTPGPGDPGAAAAFAPVSAADLAALNAPLLEGRGRHWGNVLLLGRLVAVQGLEGDAQRRYEELHQRCRGLSYFDSGGPQGPGDPTW
ncbi:hypothetical protein HYH03_002033 [Edaphochlamys debaryana]|uniref:Nucleotide-diphospho-sugar transferase domain-containing protein n=1 Tax=Edaphochlamys debaryana TaxID=47281 RepID=A0A835YGF0_9CHLO|nr:hypothetical protein HYH03_002033 [Edaphochlamys debaryana]|eukprot:KAG2500466.1 hypothetical protein HYH03_002033 [Edaphochlamys debaryana]